MKASSLALKTRTSSPSFSRLSAELLSLGLGVRFRAPGTSMHPTIRHDDVITVEPIEPNTLKRGDIILYRFKSGFIAHRIVNIEEGNDSGLTFILRGDASTTCDGPVAPEQILGKIVCLERDHQIIDPYILRVRLWTMLYLLLARVRRGAIHWFIREQDRQVPL